MTRKYSEKLALEYRNDLKSLKIAYEKYKNKRDQSKQLQRKYEEMGNWKLANHYLELSFEYQVKAKELASIISSSEYSIKWLETGFEPKLSGGLSKLSYEKRTIQTDNIDELFHLFNKVNSRNSGLTNDEQSKLEDFLNCLTETERAAFISIKGQGNSYEETAEFLGVSKGTIQSYLKRGIHKLESAIENGIQVSLF